MQILQVTCVFSSLTLVFRKNVYGFWESNAFRSIGKLCLFHNYINNHFTSFRIWIAHFLTVILYNNLITVFAVRIEVNQLSICYCNVSEAEICKSPPLTSLMQFSCALILKKFCSLRYYRSKSNSLASSYYKPVFVKLEEDIRILYK